MGLNKQIIWGVSRTQWIAGLVVLLTALIIFFSYYDYGINLFDEGVLLEGIRIQSEGEMDYAKFCHYSSQYRFFSYFFNYFDKNLLEIRGVWVVMRVLTALFMFLISCRLMPVGWALIPALLFGLMPGPWHKSFVPFIISVSTYLAIKAYGTNRLRYFIASALVIAFGISVHIYTGLLILIPISLYGVMRGLRLYRKDRVQTDVRQGVRNSLIGFILMLFFTFILADFLRSIDYGQFFRQTISVMDSDFSGTQLKADSLLEVSRGWRHLFVTSIFFLVPLVLLSSSIYWLKRWKSEMIREKALAFQVIYIVGFFSLFKWLARFDMPHLLQNVLPIWILLVFIMRRYYLKVFRAEKSIARFGFGLGAGLLTLWTVGLILFGITSTEYYHGGIGYRWFKDSVRLQNDKAPVYIDWHDAKWLQEIVTEIQQRTTPDEHILVCAPAPILYYLSERKNPLVLPIFDRPESLFANSEREIIEQVKEKNTRLIVFKNEDTDGVAANRVSSYAPELYRFIMEEYELVRVVNWYQIRVRRDRPPADENGTVL